MKNSIEILNLIMLNEYIAVNKETNPVFKNFNSYESDEFLFLFTQYSWLSKKIASFFIEAIYVLQYYKWDSVAEELLHNIGEELGEGENIGSYVKKMPHYVLLRKGFMSSLKKDIHLAPKSICTADFINSTFTLMNDWSPAKVAGACYALECSALKELEAVYDILKKWFSILKIKIPKDISYYFESHISEIEIGHERRLRECCESFLNLNQNNLLFESGFRRMMEILSTWWMALDQEIIKRRG